MLIIPVIAIYCCCCCRLVVASLVNIVAAVIVAFIAFIVGSAATVTDHSVLLLVLSVLRSSVGVSFLHMVFILFMLLLFLPVTWSKVRVKGYRAGNGKQDYSVGSKLHVHSCKIFRKPLFLKNSAR